MAKSDEEDLQVEVEVDPVRQHRMRMLLQHGFPDDFLTFRLSMLEQFDWHYAVKLLQSGATPEQIFRILGD